VLGHPPQRDRLVDLVFTESTTFGIREYLTRRTILNRRIVEVPTPYGAVRVKIGTWRGRDVTRAPSTRTASAAPNNTVSPSAPSTKPPRGRSNPDFWRAA